MQKNLVLVCLALSVLLTVAYYTKEQYHPGIDIAMYKGCSLDMALIEEYQREHPDAAISVYDDVPAKEYPEWLAEKVLTGQVPAIFVVPIEDADKYIRLGALLELDIENISCPGISIPNNPYCLTLNTPTGHIFLGISPRARYPKAATELLEFLQKKTFSAASLAAQ